jgi:hypothetical protein
VWNGSSKALFSVRPIIIIKWIGGKEKEFDKKDL